MSPPPFPASAVLWDRFLASDPAQHRLRMAARGALSAAAATGLLAALAGWAHQSATAAMVGASVAMSSAMVVNDADPREERRTLLLLPLPAALALLLGSAVAPAPWLARAAFLPVAFASVWARRFGARGMALGTVGFFTFFFALFFHTRLEQVPWLAAGTLVVTALSYGVRFGLLRERPARMLRLGLSAVRSSAALVLHRVEGLVEQGPWSERHTRTLRAPVRRLNAAALELEALVGRAPPDALAPGLTAEGLRLRLFELELATQRVVGAVRNATETPGLTPSVRAAVRAVLRCAWGAVRTGAPAAEAATRQALADARRALADAHAGAPDLRPADARPAGAPRPPPADLAPPALSPERVVDRLEVTVSALLDAARWAHRPEAAVPTALLPGPAPERPTPGAGAAPSAAPPEARPASPGVPAPGLHASTRQAVQVTLAIALAIAGGTWLSADRWPWAVITAFAVFARPASAGEALVRSWQRVVGTLAGAAGGLLVAHAVAGHRAVEVGLVFVCLFFALYFLRVSAAGMALFITLLLALLWGLMGLLTPGLLYLRLTETLVGAAAAALVSLVVLPVPTRGQVREGLEEVLRLLQGFLAQLAVRGDERRAPPLAQARALDARARQLREAAGPLTAAPLRLAPELERAVHAASTAVFFARHLVPAHGLPSLSGASRLAVQAVVERLAARAGALASALGEGPGGPGAAEPAAALLAEARRVLALEAHPHYGLSPPVALYWMEHLDAALTEVEAAVRPLAAAGRGGGGRGA
jgi:hypothetical protein